MSNGMTHNSLHHRQGLVFLPVVVVHLDDKDDDAAHVGDEVGAEQIAVIALLARR